MPVITLNATSGKDQGPVLRSHTTKSMVTTKRQDEILLALVWAEKVRTLGASAKTLNLDPARYAMRALPPVLPQPAGPPSQQPDQHGPGDSGGGV